MRFVAVTACPTGIAHTLMAAEALKRQADIMGHVIEVETQGSDGTQHPLPQQAIEKADAVVIAADIFVDPSRFAGKPVVAASTADAIRHPHDVIASAVAATTEPDIALPEPAPAGPPQPVRAQADGQRRLVGITSCPTGIAHTFMAAEGLRRAAEDLGHWIKIETQGSVGAKNVLTPEEIAAADAVVIAADTRSTCRGSSASGSTRRGRSRRSSTGPTSSLPRWRSPPRCWTPSGPGRVPGRPQPALREGAAGKGPCSRWSTST